MLSVEQASREAAFFRDPDVKTTMERLSPAAQQELKWLLMDEHRDSTGKYWIELVSSPNNNLIREMKVLGFTYKRARGFYQ